MAETDIKTSARESMQADLHTDPRAEGVSMQGDQQSDPKADPPADPKADPRVEDASAQTETESDTVTPETGRKSDSAESALVVEGFRFLTTADAEKAKLDLAKINYLKKNLGYATSTALDAVYEKAIENQIFSTPVGWQFLAEIRVRLIHSELKEVSFSPIPVTMPLSRREAKEQAEKEQQVEAERMGREEARRKEKGCRGTLSKKAGRLIQFSLALNFVLLLLVAAMFVILNFSQTDNIVNYKRNITNRFAEREESLKEREAAIRAKERKLHLSDEGGLKNPASESELPENNTDTQGAGNNLGEE